MIVTFILLINIDLYKAIGRFLLRLAFVVSEEMSWGIVRLLNSKTERKLRRIFGGISNPLMKILKSQTCECVLFVFYFG